MRNLSNIYIVIVLLIVWEKMLVNRDPTHNFPRGEGGIYKWGRENGSKTPQNPGIYAPPGKPPFLSKALNSLKLGFSAFLPLGVLQRLN